MNFNVNPNIAYNYQKNPNLVVDNKLQSQAGLTLALRDNPNFNRNVTFIYPTNQATPNYGAGSPTLFAKQTPKPIGVDPYAGSQVL